MDNVAFDLVKHYPTSPIPPYASGQIRNAASSLCMDTGGAKVGLKTCAQVKTMTQTFEMTFKVDIRVKNRDQCFDVSTSEIGDPLTLFTCHGMLGNQEFKYNLVIHFKLLITLICFTITLNVLCLF